MFIANVQSGDKTISDTTLDTDVTKIDLNGQEGVVMDKDNAHNRTIQATGGGNYTIVDTVANLASITLAGTTAANVIANVQNGDKTISDTTLDSDVTIIDLNGQTTVVMDAANAHNRTIQATGGGNYTIVDTVANLSVLIHLLEQMQRMLSPMSKMQIKQFLIQHCMRM